MSRDARDNRVIYVLHRICGARVFRTRIVVIVWHSRLWIESDVLQHGPKAYGIPDLRLKTLRETDTLRIATTLKIENAAGAPSMFVISDEPAVRIGRESSFSGAGEAEEKCGNVVSADIRGTMHWEHVALGQQKVHDAEDGFFYFSGVVSASDEHQLAGKVRQDESFRICPVT